MGLIITLLLFAAIIAVFTWLFRKRVRTNLARADHRLPEELLRHRVAVGAVTKPQTDARPAVLPAMVPTASTARRPPHFLLIYDVAPDYVQRRAQYREEHLRLAWQSAQKGELVLAGALEDPVEQAFLLFSGSRESALRFAAADPYVRHGLVKRFRVKQWHTVVGDSAANPVRP
jgi:uncharacterized protein